MATGDLHGMKFFERIWHTEYQESLALQLKLNLAPWFQELTEDRLAEINS